MVIGVDRSFVRLNRNGLVAKHEKKNSQPQRYNDKNGSPLSSAEASKRPFQAASSNVLLVRAELTDFWRCSLEAKWNVSRHYILYPNPYPKVRTLTSFW